MPKDLSRWFYLIPRKRFEDLTAHDALDMLRYDAARVENNAPPGFYLLSTDVWRGPNVDRLRSYHLAPVWMTVAAVCADYGRSQAWEWYHAHVANVWQEDADGHITRAEQAQRTE